MKKLHGLIHSLSQGEKRYVKIRLKGNKSSSLLNTYFDFIGKQKQYSFEGIQKFAGQTVKLTQSNLSLLFEVVLKHLRGHYSIKDTEFSLRGSLSEVKILKDKGFYIEAKNQCRKLIQKGKVKEEFEVVKSAYKEYWNLYFLSGELNDTVNDKIQTGLNDICEKEKEVLYLEELYRTVTNLYYNFFFKKRDASYQKRIKKVTRVLDETRLLSDKSRHIFYEIRSIESVVNNDLESHHSYRKKQLKHLLSSSVFESESLLILMVLANTFSFLKSNGFVNELSAYLRFMERYFKSYLSAGSDSVFNEKYCDIYLRNNCFVQSWLPDEKKLEDLQSYFEKVVSKGILSNKLLVGRIYLSLVELQIINENYKDVGPLLNIFFDLAKKEKYSKHYMEGDLLFLIASYLQEKIDTFDNSLESLNRKVRRNDIELDSDQKVLLELLNDLYKEDFKDSSFYLDRLGNKQTYRLFVYKLLSSESFTSIREVNFPINDPEFNSKNDSFLTVYNL
tara:strand:+ start:665 stop:2176 length:1512 start_codon:yes stop_codon:yes gene_type:complete